MSRPSSVRRLSEISEMHVVKDIAQGRESLWRRILSSLSDQCSAAFMDNIPHEYIKLLEPHNTVRFGSMLYISICVLAATIFAYLFLSEYSTVYLSPTYGSNCLKVDRPITASYLGSLDGQWSGTRAFEPSMAAYSFSFHNFSMEDSGQFLSLGLNRDDNLQAPQTLRQRYAELMTVVETILDDTLRNIMSNQNLAENLLYLLMWSLPAYTGDAFNKQTFSFTGAPTTVFDNLEYSAAGLGSSDTMCSARSVTKFNAGTHKWSVTWKSEEFVNDKNCTTVLPLASVGFIIDSPTISFDIDVRSFFAAVSANYPKPQNLNMSRRSLYDYQVEGIRWVSFSYPNKTSRSRVAHTKVMFGNPESEYSIGQYYDERYPGMDPIWCVSAAVDGQEHMKAWELPRKTCFVRIVGDLFAYPLWNHYGAISGIFNPDLLAKACDCADPDVRLTNCNHFDFLSSFMFFKSDLTASYDVDGAKKSIFWAMAEFINRPNVQGNSVSQQGYLASWYTAPHLLMSSVNYNPNTDLDGDYTASYLYHPMTPAERIRVFDFCRTTYGNCSILSIRSTNNNVMLTSSWTSSPSYYQFIDGACAFNLFNASTWRALIDTPPTSFEEDFFKCYPHAWQAFVTSSGLALANTKAIAPFAVMFLVNLLFAWQWFTGRHYPRAYSAAEKDTVLGLIAKRVLLSKRVRNEMVVDGRTLNGGQSGDKEHDTIPSRLPIVAALTKELDLHSTEMPLEIYTCKEPVKNAPLQRISMCLRSGSGSGSTSGVKGVRSLAEQDTGIEAQMPRLTVDRSRDSFSRSSKTFQSVHPSLPPLAKSVDRESSTL